MSFDLSNRVLHLTTFCSQHHRCLLRSPFVLFAVIVSSDISFKFKLGTSIPSACMQTTLYCFGPFQQNHPVSNRTCSCKSVLMQRKAHACATACCKYSQIYDIGFCHNTFSAQNRVLKNSRTCIFLISNTTKTIVMVNSTTPPKPINDFVRIYIRIGVVVVVETTVELKVRYRWFVPGVLCASYCRDQIREIERFKSEKNHQGRK